MSMRNRDGPHRVGRRDNKRANGALITLSSTDQVPFYARHLLGAAKAYPRQRLVKQEFRLENLDLLVWFSSDRLADLCRRSLFERKSAGDASARAEIFAIDAEADGWEQPAKWSESASFTSRSFETVLASQNLRGFYHHEAPSWQFFDVDQATGVLTIPGPLSIPPWESGSPLRVFLHWMYAAANMRLVHAATLGHDGFGALIAGPSGSGKSATALAGLLNGLESAGDDYVLVAQGPPVMAFPVFRVFKQDRQGLLRAGIPARQFISTALNWHAKVEFDPVQLASKGITDRIEIRAIFIAEIARALKTAIEPATSREAALSLAPSGVFQLPGDAAEGFRFLASLVRELPAFRLRLSEDAREIADTVGSFLSEMRIHAG
jgi:hypothetical protein